MSVIIEVQYLPPIEYVAVMANVREFIIDNEEMFVKRSYRNRAYIAGANGIQMLVVPVHDSRKKILTREIRIDNHSNWQANHWKTIRSAYGNSPYYEHYSDKFQPLFQKRFTYIFDFDLSLIRVIADILGIPSEAIQVKGKIDEESIKSYSGCIIPKKINRADAGFASKITYPQVFEDRYGFIPNLSCIDLIFNVGPRAKNLLEKLSIPVLHKPPF